MNSCKKTANKHTVDRFLHDHIVDSIDGIFKTFYTAANLYEMKGRHWTTIKPSDQCPDIGIRGSRKMDVAIEVKTTVKTQEQLESVFAGATTKYNNRLKQSEKIVTQFYKRSESRASFLKSVYGQEAFSGLTVFERNIIRDEPTRDTTFIVIVASQPTNISDYVLFAKYIRVNSEAVAKDVVEFDAQDVYNNLPMLTSQQFTIFRLELLLALIRNTETIKDNPEDIKFIFETLFGKYWLKASKYLEADVNHTTLVFKSRLQKNLGAINISWCFKDEGRSESFPYKQI